MIAPPADVTDTGRRVSVFELQPGLRPLPPAQAPAPVSAHVEGAGSVGGGDSADGGAPAAAMEDGSGGQGVNWKSLISDMFSDD